jgi:hypothetical protein
MQCDHHVFFAVCKHNYDDFYGKYTHIHGIYMSGIC